MKREMKNPTISIGIPTYLGGEHLSRTLQSVYQQSYYRYVKEIVLVVDGNKIDKKIIKTMLNKKLKIITFRKREGQSKRINDIFRIARSNLLILINDDVILTKNAIK